MKSAEQPQQGAASEDSAQRAHHEQHAHREPHETQKPHGGAPGSDTAESAGDQPTSLPGLSESERKQVERRTALSALIVHETVREEGERELRRTPTALAYSGLAAGLSMGFSMVGQGLLYAHLPDAPWRPLLASLGYSIGFLIVVLGRQQLFTENTLTVILPLLAHPTKETCWRVARLWGIVLVANLLGAYVFAVVVAQLPVFPPEVLRAFTEIGRQPLGGGFGSVLLRGIFAGWLIALMVWLLPAAQAARLHIIIILTYLVSLAVFPHIIAGAVEAFFLVSRGEITWAVFFMSFLWPTLIGNIIGGVSLVAGLNYAQVVTEGAASEV